MDAINQGERPVPVRHLDEELVRAVPIAESDHTALGPGPPELEGPIGFLRNGLVVGNVRFRPKFIGHTVLDPGWASISVLLHSQDRYYFNGKPVINSSICVSTHSEGYFTQGTDVEVGTFGVPVARLKHDLAALLGADPDVVALPDGVLELPPAKVQVLRRIVRKSALLLDKLQPPPDQSQQGGDDAAFEALTEALLQALFVQTAGGRDDLDITIVRRAEEYFMNTYPCQPALVDLCAAARVGKTRLYKAFHGLLGESPASYFHRRRLSSARKELRRTPPTHGVIKRVAIDNGFTALGRFSINYRRLFGESPSTTLEVRE